MYFEQICIGFNPFLYNDIVFFTHHLADFLFSRDVKVSAQSIFQSAVAVVVKDKFYLPVRTSKDVVVDFSSAQPAHFAQPAQSFLSRDIHGRQPAPCLPRDFNAEPNGTFDVTYRTI